MLMGMKFDMHTVLHGPVTMGHLDEIITGIDELVSFKPAETSLPSS